MNPVVASSLISVGSNLLNRVITSSPNLSSPGSTSFYKELLQVSTAEKSLSRDELKKEFITSPAVKSFIDKNSGDTLYLEERADGSMKILSSTGQSLVLSQGSVACATAKKFFELCIQDQVYLSTNRANAVEIKV